MGGGTAHPARAVSCLDALCRLLVNECWVRPGAVTGTGVLTRPGCGLWLLAGAPAGCALMRVDPGEGRVRDWELFVCPNQGNQRRSCASAPQAAPCCIAVFRAAARHVDAAVRHGRISALAIIAPEPLASRMEALLACPSRAVLRRVGRDGADRWAAPDIEAWLFSRPRVTGESGAFSSARSGRALARR